MHLRGLWPFVVGRGVETMTLLTTEGVMKKIKVDVKKIDLKPRKTDYRFTWRYNGELRYEDANFRPEARKTDLSERVKLLPY
jgi:hypothetical protein